MQQLTDTETAVLDFIDDEMDAALAARTGTSACGQLRAEQDA